MDSISFNRIVADGFRPGQGRGSDCLTCPSRGAGAAAETAPSDGWNTLSQAQEGPHAGLTAISGDDVVQISPVGRALADNESGLRLSQAEQVVVNRLRARDTEVRAHERAHQAAGGATTGGASYSYTRGPNGRLYATGGEVAIDASPVPGNPDATIRKAELIRRAALAPARPSAQDRAVAARATRMAAEARMKKSLDETAETDQTKGWPPPQTATTAASPDPASAIIDLLV